MFGRAKLWRLLVCAPEPIQDTPDFTELHLAPAFKLNWQWQFITKGLKGLAQGLRGLPDGPRAGRL
jgi:hypothetical protein